MQYIIIIKLYSNFCHYTKFCFAMNLNCNKPKIFSRNLDGVDVEAWNSSVENYLRSIKITNQPIAAKIQIDFAAPLFYNTAATWWYSVTQSLELHDILKATGPNFVEAIRPDFVPQRNQNFGRVQLQNVYQKHCVSEYLDEFRDIARPIPGMSQDEKLDRFNFWGKASDQIGSSQSQSVQIQWGKGTSYKCWSRIPSSRASGIIGYLAKDSCRGLLRRVQRSLPK